MTSATNRTDIVPGVMHCAKCKFEITRITLAVNIGAAIAGDNQSEPCPNGCGPLWPVTWEQAARKAWAVSEQLVERAIAAEQALAELRSRLGPKVVAGGRGEPSAPVTPVPLETWSREDVEAVEACLGDDAAQLREENGEDERAANMDRAASMLTWMLLTHPAYAGQPPGGKDA
jgi:hypothetical protein